MVEPLPLAIKLPLSGEVGFVVLGVKTKTSFMFTFVAVRLISAESRIDQQAIRTGKLKQEHHDRIVKSLGRL